MELLSNEQLNDAVRKANTIPSTDVLERTQIEQIKGLIDFTPPKGTGLGKCLPNAYQVATITNAKIIEGIALIELENGDVTVIKHAWNILDARQFDITMDLVWPNFGHKLKEIVYWSAQVYSMDQYDLSKGRINFQSEADSIAFSFRYRYTTNTINAGLNKWGLEKEYHEQILKECIASIKKT